MSEEKNRSVVLVGDSAFAPSFLSGHVQDPDGNLIEFTAF